jgi:hypothetical protein
MGMTTMQNLPLELVAYFEGQIRTAARETGSGSLLRNAERLRGLLQERNRDRFGSDGGGSGPLQAELPV